MSEHEQKTFKFELKEVSAETGIFEGYGSTFGGEPDSYGDIVDKGAFAKTIQEGGKRIKILWNHQTLEPIGKPLELREDEHGLYIKGKLSLGVQRAREVLALMKDGVINELSIGYDTITEAIEGKIRHLKEVRLWDVSPVSFAANPSAMILDVKAAEYALAHGNIDSIQESVKSLQALLDKYQGKHEPPKGTHAPEVNQEAANLEQMLDGIQSEIDGFDVKQANARIDAAMAKL